MPRRMHCSAVVSTPPCWPAMIGGAQRAVLPRLAFDSETPDQIEREHRRVVAERDHAPAEIGAERRLDRVGVELQAGIELAAIIARRAPAGLLGFEHDRLGALFGQMQRGRQSGKAAADDRDRHVLVDVERRRRNRRDGSVRIEARRQGKGIVGHGHTSPADSLHKGCSTRRRKSCVRACCGWLSTDFAAPCSTMTPPIDEQHPVGDLAGKAHLVGDDDHRHAVVGELAHDRRALRRPVRDRAPRSARRTGSPCGCIASARAMATRCCWPPEKLRRIGVVLVGQAHLRQQRAAALERLGARLLLHVDRAFDDVLERRAVRKQVEALEHHRHLGRGSRRSMAPCGRPACPRPVMSPAS